MNSTQNGVTEREPLVRFLDRGRAGSIATIEAEVLTLRSELASLQTAFQALADLGQRVRLEQRVCSLQEGLETQLAAAVTEMARTNGELALTNDLLRLLADAIGDLVYVKDRESRFLLCNQSCAAHLGVPAATLTGTTGVGALPPDALEIIIRQDRQVLETGQAHRYQETLRFALNDYRSFLTTKLPFRDVSGSVAGVLGISRFLGRPPE